METLLDQFESKVIRVSENESHGNSDSTRSFEESCKDQDASVQAADMEIVKQMRQNITSVLGDKLSPTEYI